MKRRWLLLALMAVLIGTAWFFLGQRFDGPQEVAAFLREQTVTPWAKALVPVGFAVAIWFFVPITALILGCALVFPPAQAFAFVMVGAVLGALGSWLLGRVAAGPVLEHFRGEKWQRLTDSLRTHPFKATLVLRMLPVGGFSLTNLFAGAVRVPLMGFVLGNIVGVLPSAVLFTLLGGRVPGLLENPRPVHFVVLGLAVILVVGVMWGMKRWLSGPRATGP